MLQPAAILCIYIEPYSYIYCGVILILIRNVDDFLCFFICICTFVFVILCLYSLYVCTFVCVYVCIQNVLLGE